ncbi:MAG: hypothetical protein L6R41_002543 [Letrouitia leprolyta]|nr:MAG: hypothetical protein L6R41_002543 [Letrouitia leprolyta]
MLSSTLSLILPFAALVLGSPLNEKRTNPTTACNSDNVLRCIAYASATGTKTATTTTTVTITATSKPTLTSTIPATITITPATNTIPVTITVTVTPVTTTSVDATTITVEPVTSTEAPPETDTDPPEKRAINQVATTFIYGTPIAVVAPHVTNVLPLEERHLLQERVTTSPAPAPTCLAQYSPAPSRISSACNCLSITSTTVRTVSTAPTTTTTRTVTALASATVTQPTTIPLTVTATIPVTATVTAVTTQTFAPPKCTLCTLCNSDADCSNGATCVGYIGFSFGDVNLCSNFPTPCNAICTP